MAEIQSISKSIKIKDLRALCLSCNLDTSNKKRSEKQIRIISNESVYTFI